MDTKEIFGCRRRSGYTLIELLLVIGIIGILSAIVIVALNPMRHLGFARNAARRSHVVTLLQVVQQFIIANGQFPQDAMLDKRIVNEEQRPICRKYVDYFDCADNNGVYLTILTFDGNFFADIPVDPSEQGTCNCPVNCDPGCWDSGYTISLNANGRFTVIAPHTEGDGPDISLTN